MIFKSIFLRTAACAVLFVPLVNSAGAAEPVMPSAADTAQWESFRQDLAKNLETAPTAPKSTPLEQVLLPDRNARKRSEASLAFYRAHSASPIRWEAAQMFLAAHPKFVTGAKPEYEQNPVPGNLSVDEVARSQWEKTAAEIQSAMAQATNVPVTIAQSREAQQLSAEYMKASTREEFLAIGARLKAHVNKYAQLPVAAPQVGFFAWAAIEKKALTFAEAWQMFADSAHPGVKQLAAKKLAALELFKKPLDISFVALDGRKVDLKEMRGKVVLVDFWATWCHPCVAELPNVAANYKKYHDQGFEVIGIALEFAHLTPNDTPEQKAGKQAKARQVLSTFLASRDLPWPQLCNPDSSEGFDEKYGIDAIPAMFLLDQSGMVVSTEARGPALEPAIRRLLKLN